MWKVETYGVTNVASFFYRDYKNCKLLEYTFLVTFRP
jgi:hypothetical protein